MTLFLELKFPLENHVPTTISPTYLAECTVMVKGSSVSFWHAINYIWIIFTILKEVVLRHTSDVYAAFKNTRTDTSKRRGAVVRGACATSSYQTEGGAQTTAKIREIQTREEKESRT